jgi:hypothetical protein
MKKRETKPVIVKIKSGNQETVKSVHLYLFDNNGKLIESAAFKNGEAELKTNGENIEGKTQLIIGPVLPKEFKGRELNPLLLRKMGGYQPPVHLTADNEINIIGLPRIPIPILNWCLITGCLTKIFNIDGQDKTLPVCDARVHICEVDRILWWWWRIPPYIIDELGKKLQQAILDPSTVIPPHGPGPDPGPIMSMNELRYSTGSQNLLSQNNEIRSFSAQIATLPEDVQNGLLSPSAPIVRDTIYNNFHLLHPYLCYWPWFWPWFYISEEIGTVYSDCNGRFSYEYLNITNDEDIYIWVEVCINGQWITVYRPPVPCSTYWDYICGTDININITDPRVMPCNCGQQLQGELVWFRSIGEYATAQHIEQGDSNTVNIQGVSFPNVGCTDIITDSLGNNNPINPFGSTLYFKLLFGDGLPSAGITHYRWKKTNIKDAALNNVLFPGTTVVNGLVQKYYFVITTDSGGNMHFETKAVMLGALGTGENIGYRIPHWDIYSDPGVPAADKLLTIAWTSPDFWSASLDSTSLPDGVWQFDLELLSLDSAGTFHVVEVPKQVFQLSDYNNSGNSVDAPDSYLNIDIGNNSNAFNLQVKVRIDNAKCYAHIQDATIFNNGVTEYSGKCGFLHYTDDNQKVNISFNASQLRNFATFHFWVVKGDNTDPINPSIDQGAYVDSGAGIYILFSGIFSGNVLVSQLRGSCPQAAFAENLYVYSLATDGTRRLWEYDDSDTNAFALSTT